MALADILDTEAIIPGLKSNNKKQLLSEMSSRAARLTGLPERDIFDVILQRERLGSTGVGNGIAIPHGKLAELGKLYGVFARAEKPIPFESIDDQPVDLIFLLLAPQNAGADHLKALARVSRLLRDAAFCERLRATRDATALHALLVQGPASRAA